MPFGLNGAPFSLADSMDYVIQNCDEFSATFYDDIIVHSENEKEHYHHVEIVLDILATHGIHVNLEKCQFAKTIVKFLRHTVTAEDILPAQDNTDNIIEFRVPRNADDVRSFLGMAGFYKRFVPNFARIAQPLFDLLKKKGLSMGSQGRTIVRHS